MCSNLGMKAMGKHLLRMCALLVCCVVVFSTASGDVEDHFDSHNHFSPLLHMLSNHDESRDEPLKAAAITDPADNQSTATAPSTIRVTSLTEAITLAVMSGICGPSLIALIGCGIRQIRLTWDDPFAGGERPVDEAAERRKRKKRLQFQEDEVEDENIINNRTAPSKVVTNNLDPMNLDRVATLDLDKIRSQFPVAKYSNTEKNLAGKVNKGFSKTAEDIL